MNMLVKTLSKKTIWKSVLIDLGAAALILFLPSLAHMTRLPLYFIEPMRLMLVLALAHTDRRNAYLLALLMPLFSYWVSGHPLLPKMLLITGELLLNVFLFFLLKDLMKKAFPAMLLSILASKAVYYFLKFLLIDALVLNQDLFATPAIVQICTTIFFSGYLWYFGKRNRIS